MSETIDIARKASRPVHQIVFNKTWNIFEAKCGASTHRYIVSPGTPADVTCKKCSA